MILTALKSTSCEIITVIFLDLLDNENFSTFMATYTLSCPCLV